MTGSAWSSFGIDVLNLEQETMMSRLYAFGAWLTGSMALVLVALSLVLVPQNSVFADGPDEPSGCLGNADCSVTCYPFAGDCTGRTCNKGQGTDPYFESKCGACGCVRVGSFCNCIFVP